MQEGVTPYYWTITGHLDCSVKTVDGAVTATVWSFDCSCGDYMEFGKCVLLYASWLYREYNERATCWQPVPEDQHKIRKTLNLNPNPLI